MQPAIPNPNTIPISPAAQAAICIYPLSTIRKGYNIQEYVNFQRDWGFFNTVWSYNYTVSTLNGQGGLYQPWQFTSGQDRTSYSNGQAAHIAAYPSSVTVFNNIGF
jgi:hypothetical protein